MTNNAKNYLNANIEFIVKLVAIWTATPVTTRSIETCDTSSARAILTFVFVHTLVVIIMENIAFGATTSKKIIHIYHKTKF